MTEHGQFQEMLGAYALDAVDGEEREEIERHLAGCPRCRAEAAEHREVAGLLGYAGSDAPPGLWDRIVVSLEEPPPALQLARIVTSESATRPAVDSRGAGSAVVPIGLARRAIGVRAFAVLAAVAAVVAVVLGIEVVRLNNRTNTLNNSIGEVAIQSAYRAARSNPGARLVMMRSADQARTATAVILPDGTAFLDPRNLRALPASETYQLWGVVGADKVSLAVLGSTPRLVEFGAPGNVTALALTAERAGGVVTSHQQPSVAGTLALAIHPPAIVRTAGDTWAS